MTKFITLLALLSFSLNLAAQDVSSFLADAEDFFSDHVSNGTVDYAAVKQDPRLAKFVDEIARKDYSRLSKNTKKAYLINVYNLLVISQVIEKYPIASVQETGAFFEKESVTIAGKKFSLTKFEKEEILKPFNDPRLHFVLVCGAKGCPPITNFAYTPDKLDEQMDKQTKMALNDPAFLTVEGNTVKISKIFEWYSTDFGSNKAARFNFINQYRNERIPSSGKFKYVNYDWSINDSASSNTSNLGTGSQAANSARYVTSSTIPKGTVELRFFNNLFTQRFEENANRSNFFTTTVSALYGVNKRFNAGLEFKYRRVSNSTFPSSVLTVFGNDDDPDVFNTRARITGIGPKIRWAPTAALPNFSIQSTLQFPVGDDLQGTVIDNETIPFIDWDGVLWNTQFFNDISIGTRFSLFTEIDLFFEDLGSEEEGRTNRFSTPATIIFSYFPNPNTTIYTIGNYSPIFQEDFDYFYQYGLGLKYQFSPSFELELIVTDFTTKFVADNNGQAATFNLGLRYNIQ